MLDLESELSSNLDNWSSDAERGVKLMNGGVTGECIAMPTWFLFGAHGPLYRGFYIVAWFSITAQKSFRL